jgi:cytochrome P450
LEKKLSLFETAQVAALILLPSYTQGLFTKRRFWVALWSRLNIDRFAIRLVSRLRSRHGKRFSTRIGSTTTVILLDHEEIKEVLANSPNAYVDAESKHVGMSHFQPGALTISRGEEWKDRRRYNEAVLNTGRGVHEYANRFLEIVVDATSAMSNSAGDRLRWRHFDELFSKIAAGVIFGIDARGGGPLFARLGKMMRESNRVFALKKSRHFDAFYNDLEAQLGSPGKHSLAALCLQTPHGHATKMAQQIPHWMFAIRETLPANTIRALALIAAHPDSERRVCDELTWSGELTPSVVDGLDYLGGCVQEAMRLWPTTPFIARFDPVRSQQILILNTFNHRDSETNLNANTFDPEQWIDHTPTFPFNHLSSGTQVCAGKDLALFIAKATISALFRENRFRLERPEIDPSKPMRASFNYFRTSFSVRPRSSTH